MGTSAVTRSEPSSAARSTGAGEDVDGVGLVLRRGVRGAGAVAAGLAVAVFSLERGAFDSRDGREAVDDCGVTGVRSLNST